MGNNIKIEQKNNSFNKILVTGNSNINFKNICSLLYENDIEKAEKPKNYDFSPEKIGEIILKEKTDNINGTTKISRVWDSLVLDFFLSNIDKKIWAWCDKNSLYILDYWKEIDDKLFFVLVYESPVEVIKRVLKEKKEINDIEIQLLKWKEEIDNILNFYHKNRERCIIVNSSNIVLNKRKYLENIGNKINIKIETNIENIDETDKEREFEIDFLISKYLENNLLVLDKFEEIQTFADIPYFNENSKNVDYLALALELLNYEEKISKIEKEKKEIEKTKEDIEKEKELLLSQLMTTQEELEKVYIEKKEREEKLNSLEREYKKQTEEKNRQINELKKNIENKDKEYKEKISKIEKEKVEIEKERELLLSQLMTTQEELEKLYLENKQLKEKQENKKKYYGAADRIKSQLSYRLGAKMIEIAKNKPLLLPFLPFILLKVRKEYKEYMKNRPKLPPIHAYADYYEAERVKRHLSYMLGETTITTLKSNPFGVFVLPFRLKETYKIFKQQRDK